MNYIDELNEKLGRFLQCVCVCVCGRAGNVWEYFSLDPQYSLSCSSRFTLIHCYKIGGAIAHLLTENRISGSKYK